MPGDLGEGREGRNAAAAVGLAGVRPPVPQPERRAGPAPAGSSGPTASARGRAGVLLSLALTAAEPGGPGLW